MSDETLLRRLAQAARELGAHVGPELVGLGEDRAARRALAALAEAELLGWCVPARFGGADAQGLAPDRVVSVRALCTLRGALAYHSGMLDVMLVMQGLGSFALTLGGGESARKLLPLVAGGQRVAAFALTEPGAGSSLTDIATRAQRAGAGWRLDGTKTFISNAGLADFYTLLARTDGAPGDRAEDAFTMFLVPGDAPGLSVERFEVMAPHPIGTLTLSGVELAAEAAIGEVGAGLPVALATLARFRTSVAAAANGFARRALDEAVAHLVNRRQFGRPLSSFQGLRFELAEMDTRLRAAELLVEEAARAVDGEAPSAAAVARAKLFATETAGWICDRAVQHLGGRGVVRGEIVERLYREVRALRIYEGTSEIQKLILAKEILPDS